MDGPEQGFRMGIPMVTRSHLGQMVLGRRRGQNPSDGLRNFPCNGLISLGIRRHLPSGLVPNEAPGHRQVRANHRQPRVQEVKQLVGQAEPEIVDGRSVQAVA